MRSTDTSEDGIDSGDSDAARLESGYVGASRLADFGQQVLVWSVILFVLFFVIYNPGLSANAVRIQIDQLAKYPWLVYATAASSLTGALLWFVGSWRKNKISSTLLRMRAGGHRAALNEITKLTELLIVNEQRIAEYHAAALRQAKKAFRSAQVSAGIGLLALAGFFYFGIVAEAGNVRILASSFGMMSAVLGGYLSRTYIKIYGEALGQLNMNFQRHVADGRFLSAERIAESLHAELLQDECRRMIVIGLIEGSSREARRDVGGSDANQ